MIISDLSYLETVSEASNIEGGILNFVGRNFSQRNNTRQDAKANAGNNRNGGISILNVAAAANVATPLNLSL